MRGGYVGVGRMHHKAKATGKPAICIDLQLTAHHIGNLPMHNRSIYTPLLKDVAIGNGSCFATTAFRSCPLIFYELGFTIFPFQTIADLVLQFVYKNSPAVTKSVWG